MNDSSISFFQVRAEDADVLIIHNSCINHPLFFTTSNGSYDVMRIQESPSERQRSYLLFCHAFIGCDLLLPLLAMGKPLYLISFVLEMLMNTWITSLMYMLVGMRRSGLAFQFFSTALAAIPYSMFS